MILFQVKDLAKFYGINKIFENVEFVIEKGDKIGLIGVNGAGKSTLLHCITGEKVPDKGYVTTKDNLKIGFLAQLNTYPIGTIAFEAIMEVFIDIIELRKKMRKLEYDMGRAEEKRLEQIMNTYAKVTEEYERAGGFSCESLAKGIASGLGLSEEDLRKDINTFSGGEKTRLCMARLLARETEVLLLDEPTNHLDLAAVEWLESYLRTSKSAAIIISHDRYFLDKVTNKTMELENGQLIRYPVSYSGYVELKAEKVKAQNRAYIKQQEEIDKLDEYIRRNRAGIKAKQARGRQSWLEKIERIAVPVKKRSVVLKTGKQAIEGSGDIVLSICNLSFAFAEKTILNDISFTIRKNEKTALIGGNGAGKSTLLKIVTGEISNYNGSVTLGKRVLPGYFSQEHSNLNPEIRVLDELVYNCGLTIKEARAWLGSFLFSGDDVYKMVGELSGGEKGRLSFLKIILDSPNFLILDEPTNHLDISTRSMVEKYLKEYKGTLLVVSHDRYLLDNTANRILELSDGTICEYIGNYSYYKEKKEQLLQTERKETASKKAVEKPIEKPKINKAKTRERISLLEENIGEMENRLAVLSDLLAKPDTYQDEEEVKLLVQEYKHLEDLIPKSYEEWEKLNEMLAEI